ncbi:MAG: LysR family transcriptional regulator [Rhizobiaceae bacterium]|nr:LysR family transcriptional regulator [Rhizobiaceae bacterium]
MKALNHVHLNGLRALEVCGRLGSLKEAAAELGVTTGAVSQQVIRAEAQLGRAVFERTAHGLKPTRFGEDFLQRLSSGFSMLEQAVASAARHADNVLTISVAPVLASKWLVPRLSRYLAAHPGMQVRLDASIGLIDPSTSDIDIAIRVGPGGWPGVREEAIMEQEIFPVCAPDIAARLKEPADLLGVPVVTDANSNLRWQTWLDRYSLSEKDLTPGSSYTDAALALDAVIAGQGVMLAWQTLAEYGLRMGTLVAPFPHRARTGKHYWLITAPSRREDGRVRGFKDWIRSEIAETERMFGPLENTP